MDQIDDTPDQTTDSNRTDFRAELSSLLNRHSMENGSDTPDFLLAEYMADCLDAFDRMMTKRASWYAPEPKAANAGIQPPTARVAGWRSAGMTC